ncbi:sodium/glutamate symporter [Fusobacterium sp. MFO224]|uniref:sodium/glutamate symporter n=1 Tax=Fusobacterium sp. MFO224 TaxID=3378070 RepID=UPI003851F4F0
MLNIKIDMFQTLGVTVLLIWLGNYLRSKLTFLKKYCIPASVVGGLLFALVTLGLHNFGIVHFTFDKAVINRFFYCVFFAASGAAVGLKLLKKGGKIIIIFTILVAILETLQNVLAIGVGKLFNINPLIALMTGSTPMTGGHGNAAAFAPVAEAMGATGAMEVALAAATFGLVAGCIVGGPLGKRLVEKHKLQGKFSPEEVEEMEKATKIKNFVDPKRSMLAVCLMFIAIGFGSVLFNAFKVAVPSVKLPIHVMCMFGGLVVRNVYEKIHGEREDVFQSVDIIGEISLAMFITMSIMTMKLWQLAGLAIPMVVMLACQVLLAYLFVTQLTFRFLGKNYDAAIMAVGHNGFGLGATPVAMATMKTVCDEYGYSKLAFFVVPLLGGLLCNLTNAVIITSFLNLFK